MAAILPLGGQIAAEDTFAAETAAAVRLVAGSARPSIHGPIPLGGRSRPRNSATGAVSRGCG